ncbi:hypothetical protein B0J11DRAFT_567829 [Dendryphion nanum]|uniref:Uncharacterized protein n=1 Tax=Dendryphion nanum TaxID=256645 RepID=A0A9P9DXJ9_9PLEO|nr:hypothetical protein B0J11DRAFT_567829 [Dendryphion nanum]
MSDTFAASDNLQSEQRRGPRHNQIQPVLRDTGEEERTTVLAKPRKNCSQPLLDGGILVPGTHDQGPGHDPGSPQTPSSASRRSNIGLRRSDRNSIFSKSPARPSHYTRMKSIFEAASLQNPAQSRIRNTILYPQLPNVSRTCNLESHQGNSNANGHKKLANPRVPQLHAPYSTVPQLGDEICNEKPLYPTELPKYSSPTGSWSGDSDFLVDESVVQRRASPSVPSPRPRTESSYFPPVDLSREERYHCLTPQRAIPNPSLKWSGTDLQRISLNIMQQDIARLHTETQREQAQTPPPCVRNSDGEDGGDEMSPLSPNVCVERGPVRHHSSRRRHRETVQPQDSPTRAKKQPPKSCLKKNIERDAGILELGVRTSRWGSANTRSRHVVALTSNEDVSFRADKENVRRHEFGLFDILTGNEKFLPARSHS